MQKRKRKMKRRRTKMQTRRRSYARSLRRKVRRRKRKKNVPAPMPMLSPTEEATHSDTYNEGYNSGFDRGHDQGYKKGAYDGGDGIVDRLLPDATMLPGVSIDQIIASGIEQLRPLWLQILNTDPVVQRIVQALMEQTPFSLVRLGDGELLTMSQETVRSIDYVRQEGQFLQYAGVSVPDLQARDQLVESVRKATVVGVPLLRVPNYQNLAFEVFRAYEIDYRSMQLTHSTINYAIYLEGRLQEVLAHRRVLIVGNEAERLAQNFSGQGIAIAGVVSSVDGMQDIPRVMAQIAAHNFDLALVAAGIPSVVIAEKIASDFGKVALDFGHLANSIVSGETPLS